jgi:hypothetical protein
MKASGSWHRQYQRPSKPKFFGVFLFTKEVLSSSFARSFMPNFIPASFVPPQRLDHAAFLLRPLCIHDVVKDYDAVMTSIDHLQGVFGPGQSWPRPDLTLEQDLIDLGWHQKEFQCRRSFAYTVMALDESRCLGCAYIEPTTRENFDAEAYCWIRASDAARLDALLFETFRAWLDSAWPFTRVAFPGRA